MKKLFENWRKFVNESITLSDKEKIEAKRILGMGGYQLEKMMGMAINMGAKSVYEKIVGAFKSGAYGEQGVAKAEEIMKLFPQLNPVQGDFEKDSGKEVASFETGQYLTQQDFPKIENYIEIYMKNRDPIAVARQIERDARAKRDYRGYITDIGALFRRLENFGSFKDETRGVFFGRGGWRKASRLGYVTRPEDNEKIPVDSHDKAMGDRTLGNALVKTLQYVSRER
tara:strand:+ start:366 stop:1046 length:681 start_codon:yes stop_codon:yes gene_type:complete